MFLDVLSELCGNNDNQPMLEASVRFYVTYYCDAKTSSMRSECLDNVLYSWM